MKTTLIFKTEKQAGKVCTLLNNLKDAVHENRLVHFYRINKSLKVEINSCEEQDKFDKQYKKLMKNKK